MKLQLKCDRCEKIGNVEEIISNYEGDFCKKCWQTMKLANLKDEYARKEKWLKETHLKELWDLQRQIINLEGQPD